MNTATIEFRPSSHLKALPPLSLYVHIPWCIQKCPYCDFNSHQIQVSAHQRQGVDEQAYIEALLIDLQNELPYIWGRPIETIFIGGGTPSVFSAQAINQLLSGIRALVKIQPDAEITLEANPSTFEREKFQGFKEAGINRLSVGVQSFDDEKLRVLGRVHNSHEARLALETAIPIFERVNIDLMYALPHQTPEQAQKDVQIAIDLGVSHISAYHLTMEPNTAFGHTPPCGLPEEDLEQDIEDMVHQTLRQAGFEQYETSAFARSVGQRARHNVNYWQFGDYIGIGAGAHGKISHHSHIERTTRVRHPNDYLRVMRQSPLQAMERKKILSKDLGFEFMMNALRLVEGVPSAFLVERTGVNPAQLSQSIELAQQKGLLHSNPMRFQATELGRRFLNDLIQCFL